VISDAPRGGRRALARTELAIALAALAVAAYALWALFGFEGIFFGLAAFGVFVFYVASGVEAASTVAGFLAAAAIAAGIVAIVFYPGRIGPGAILVALVACAIGGPARRLAALSLGVATLCWLAGMIVAVALERPLF
jgi:hypothetical protein